MTTVPVRGVLRTSAHVVALGLVLSACTPAPAPTTASSPASPAAAAPSQRGAGGTLRVLYWQAPTILNTHLAQGTKDHDAARVVLEPLAAWDPDARPVPVLASEIPTVSNGGVSKDLTSVTWKLRPDVRWSDGSRFTAADVVFTYKFMADPATAAVTQFLVAGVKSVEALNDLTVKVTYSAPTPNVYQVFVGVGGEILQEAQFKDFLGDRAKNAPGNRAPIGTGPYKVKEFKSGDVVIYELNDNYRDASKPYFNEVVLKGGGDPTSAARAVFQTGDSDYSWNLQVEAAVLRPMIEAPDSRGVFLAVPGQAVERLVLNRADPDPRLGDKRAEPDQPHPFLSDLRVRQALAMAIDRGPIAKLYGDGLLGDPTCNLVTGSASYTSKNTASLAVCRADVAAASKLLDDAGWTKRSDGFRYRDGVRMRILFQTSENPVRQKEQLIVKDAWTQLGVDVQLKSIVGQVFFGRETDDTAAKFFADVQMYANGGLADPTSYLAGWTSAQIKTKSAGWSGGNYARWSNKEYDALFDRLGAETDPDKRNEIVIRMNDLLVADVVEIPLVARRGVTAGVSKLLKGYVPSTWESAFWDIANWRK